MKRTKVLTMIEKARKIRGEMDVIKKHPEVEKYLALEEKRKALHRKIGKHVEQYNVNADQYKEFGLVERNSSWVTVGDVKALAEKYPKIKNILLGIINSKKVYYTK